jgi:hypothetical protein
MELSEFIYPAVELKGVSPELALKEDYPNTELKINVKRTQKMGRNRF